MSDTYIKQFVFLLVGPPLTSRARHQHHVLISTSCRPCPLSDRAHIESSGSKAANTHFTRLFSPRRAIRSLLTSIPQLFCLSSESRDTRRRRTKYRRFPEPKTCDSRFHPVSQFQYQNHKMIPTITGKQGRFFQRIDEDHRSPFLFVPCASCDC